MQMEGAGGCGLAGTHPQIWITQPGEVGVARTAPRFFRVKLPDLGNVMQPPFHTASTRWVGQEVPTAGCSGERAQ